MLPIVTPDEMKACDLAADAGADVLIERAGSAVARAAVRMLGGTYGRTVTVVAGPGNNGADGRVAARHLDQLGIKVHLVTTEACPDVLPFCDLVIDAAYGTGFRGRWEAPAVGAALVLAVDLPSGVDGLTGAAGGRVIPADHTVTFAALKPGLLFSPGRELAGEIEIVDIGLDIGEPAAHMLQRADVVAAFPHRDVDAHKWHAAVRVLAGSKAMPGAAALVAAGAMRTGAGMVHLSVPGLDQFGTLPLEVVHRPLPPSGWGDDALRSLDRFHAVVLGPGLGRHDDTAASARYVAVNAPLPVVIDGDGLFALAWNAEGAAALLRQRTAPTVLTPHDGEYQLLTGALPAADRITAARRLAVLTESIVVLKGATTVVSNPAGQVLVVNAGDQRLATAGTGDVLAGVIGALLAMRLAPFEAAAAGVWIHGRASQAGAAAGLVASDLPPLIPQVLAELADLYG
jgi:ADP-dependent NAD(P)H-hydrate dehydratase / NAD(P)H-hydrate epimerase